MSLQWQKPKRQRIYDMERKIRVLNSARVCMTYI
jgi:hypothetical protein